MLLNLVATKGTKEKDTIYTKYFFWDWSSASLRPRASTWVFHSHKLVSLRRFLAKLIYHSVTLGNAVPLPSTMCYHRSYDYQLRPHVFDKHWQNHGLTNIPKKKKKSCCILTMKHRPKKASGYFVLTGRARESMFHRSMGCHPRRGPLMKEFNKKKKEIK